jgi:hypothetical protein
MKIHSAHLRSSLQFGLCLAFILPSPSHAGIEVPYWLYPEWIAAKVMDFHVRHTERIEQAQVVTQAKNNPNGTANTATATVTNSEQTVRKFNLPPVETATAKINEKHLTKEELIELRKQLRQK